MLIAFDYDGVIVDSIEQIKKLVNFAKPFFGIKHELTLDDLQHIDNLTFENVGRVVGMNEAQLPGFKEKVFNLLRRTRLSSKVFPGMPEVIKELAKEHTIIIITSNVKERVEQLLEKLNLRSEVIAILDGSDTNSKSEKILWAASKYNLEHSQIIMIGDTTSDIMQGKVAGAKTIAVSWGYQPVESLRRAEPDFIANSPQDIINIVRSISAPN